MTTILVAVMAMAMDGQGLSWADALDFSEKGVTLAAPGTYGVWAFARGDEAVSVTLGDQVINSDKPSDEKTRYVWRKLGEADLPAGNVKGKLGERVATIALSTDPQFDPMAALGGVRIWEKPEAVNDSRAHTYHDTYSFYRFPHFASREEWEQHAAKIRRRMLIGSGLLPLPERTPLNARVFDTMTYDDFIVEKVTFEARPGFLVTGNLYRPKGDGPFPAIVNPHGHWPDGRLENSERCSVPGRCITFARMGIVAFSYDMVGYADSKQLGHATVVDKEKLWGVHGFAFQLWNSVRAVDFVQSLPYVDRERIGCSGASGGGTQTFALTAIDDRIRVSAPVNMISCSMQGGCGCENAPVIRLDGVSNMDIGATMAPRPMIMVAATGDWTVETPRVEYPAVRSIYELYGAADRLDSTQIQADHNYNQLSREAVYRFFGKWLLGEGDKYKEFVEPPFTVDQNAWRIYAGDAKPEGPTGEEIVKQTIEANRAKWNAILPTDSASLEKFRVEYGPALADVFDTHIPDGDELVVDRPRRIGFHKHDGLVVENVVIHRREVGDAVPATLYRADDAALRDTVVIVHGAGKAALVDPAGGPGALVKALLNEGKCVVAIDAFLLGEHHSPFARTERAEGAFQDTFEPTDTACRVQDVLTALAYLRSRRDLSGTIDVVGLGDGGLWSLFATALDGHVRKTVVDANGFNTEDDQAWVDKFYVPCLRSVGDIATAAALIPGKLYVANTADAFKTDRMQSLFALVPNRFETAADPLTNEVIVAQIKAAS